MEIQPEELIANYCNLKNITNALYKENYPVVQKELDSAMKRIMAEQPDEETLSLLVNCLFVVLQYDVFYAFMERAKLTLIDTYESRQSMREDWNRWLEGKQISDARWLNQGKKKAYVYAALQALHLSADDFDEFPSPELKEPKWQKKSYGDFELVTIADAEIVDDGGLSADTDPTGKNYVLKDADGAVYHLNAIRKSSVPGGLHANEEHLYTADGYIEGYTGKTLREIEFEMYDEGYIFTYSTTGVDDEDAESSIWQPYEQWIQERIAKRRAQQAEFLAKYL
ncbi:MAG: hypothetical protein MJ071_00190 [Oscillospiraceae bacterium]|nr:hypothetical protein [Oscillospiraceae bacterium]